MNTTQWANIGEDPGATHAMIQRIPEVVAVAGIDYLWIFPPRRVAAGESSVIVVAAFDEDDRRRIITAHFTVARNRKGIATVTALFDEHGAAPVDAVPRIVQGVLRRLGEDTAAEPRDVLIDGRQDRWDALVTELGGRPAPPDAEPEDYAANDAAEDAAENAEGGRGDAAGADAVDAAGDTAVDLAGTPAMPAPLRTDTLDGSTGL